MILLSDILSQSLLQVPEIISSLTMLYVKVTITTIPFYVLLD